MTWETVMLVVAGMLGVMAVCAVFVGLDEAPASEDTEKDDETPPDTALVTDGPSIAPPDPDQAPIHVPGGAILPGDDDDETLAGTEGDDQINGYDGDDLITSAGGNDWVLGGDGQDSVYGEAGNDTLEGGRGDDLLEGGTGADYLAGGTENDTLFGGAGDDSLVGGTGDDQVEGGDGEDWVAGRHGQDTLTGGLGVDTLSGFDGDDMLDGRVLASDGADIDGIDFLNGGDDDDILIAGAGDIMSGGSGADTGVFGLWGAGEEPAVWPDFDPSADDIVVLLPKGGAATVSLEPTPEDPSIGQLMLDGEPVALIHNGGSLSASDVTLLRGSADQIENLLPIQQK
ncbi:calcium-binding protein [Cognatishimia activa]|nr:calcium-binding protein [Cognatishimia activa]